MPELALEPRTEGIQPALAAPRPQAEPAAKPAEGTKPPRLISLDAYRGFIMLAMASGGFYISGIVRKPPYSDSPFWRFLAYQLDHVEWTGGGFWDMIQPSFMFMVGVAIPYSYAARKAKGDSERQVWFHTILRSLVLVALGVFLASGGHPQTNFLFTNVLAQIGLGYCFVYWLHGRGWKVQLGSLAAILVGYWLLFALYPLPSADFNIAEVGITPEWEKQHWMSGLFAHWNKNVNAAWDFDRWFLNLFPRETPFKFERGGYQTLNFVPSMATMILGLMAGELLRNSWSKKDKFVALCLVGILCLGLGLVLDQTICPSVKRIWTPSWAIYSSGWTFLMLAGFFGVIDLLGYQRWAFALVIVGMNSIAVYMMAQLLKGWVSENLRRHLGQTIFEGKWFGHQVFPAEFAPAAQSVGFLIVLWLASLWMYRQKIFVKV
jgi:predicted acyltransferase